MTATEKRAAIEELKAKALELRNRKTDNELAYEELMESQDDMQLDMELAEAELELQEAEIEFAHRHIVG